MRILILVFLIIGCESFDKDNEPHEPEKIDTLEITQQRKTYCELSKELYEEKGYVHDKCDGLLFTSLHALACPYVSIEAFQKSPGLWKRSPTHDCFSKGESRSGLSRDMILGVLFYAWQYNRLDIIDSLISYGRDNDWYMCGGEYESEKWRLGRCKMSKTIIATIYEVGVALGYECDTGCNLARAVPQVWNPYETGFQAHLLNIHILLRGLVQGAINDNQIAQLKYQAERVPQNQLFLVNSAIWGGGDINRSNILYSSYFPKDRLPSSNERCTDYLWQRDFGKDWEKCPQDNEVYHGTDFLLVSVLLLQELRGQKYGPIY